MDSPETRTGKPGTSGRIWFNNLPYVVMFVLGTTVLGFTFADSVWRWLAPLTYLVYGVAGGFWVMFFMCPYCASFGSPLCPSGHGLIAARFRSRRRDKTFARQFKRHIPVIVPLWFIPLIVGGVGLVGEFSWGVLLLLVAYGVDALVVLPLVATRHGCAHCPQRGNCPWMRGRLIVPRRTFPDVRGI